MNFHNSGKIFYEYHSVASDIELLDIESLLKGGCVRFTYFYTKL